MTTPIRLGNVYVTVEETRNQILVTDDQEVSVAINSPTTSSSTEGHQLLNYSHANLLTVTSGKTKFVFPVEAVLLGVTPSVNTAPTGSDIIIDLNVNDVSVFDPGVRPRIVEGSEIGPEVSTFLDATMQAGDYLTIDIDQIGSTNPGDYLNVTVRYQLA